MVLGSLDSNPIIDVAIDGADEVDEHLNLIKGNFIKFKVLKNYKEEERVTYKKRSLHSMQRNSL